MRLMVDQRPALACMRVPPGCRVRNIRLRYQGTAMVTSGSLQETNASPSSTTRRRRGLLERRAPDVTIAGARVPRPECFRHAAARGTSCRPTPGWSTINLMVCEIGKSARLKVKDSVRGKDSQEKGNRSLMPAPQFYDGEALVSWSEPDVTIAVPWYLSLMFRTRQPGGTLMQANAGRWSTINLMVIGQQVRLEVWFKNEMVASLVFTKVRVSDGEWHHLLVELSSVKDGTDIKYIASVSLDYGMYQRSVEIGNELPGLKVRTLFVGGLPGEGNRVTKGFTGCIQRIAMAMSQSSTATTATFSPEGPWGMPRRPIFGWKEAKPLSLTHEEGLILPQARSAK
ncbi:hypothetical protein CRUP_014408 [Coryphaenoides rupestris]|nr:hypothetical protein CRUP_014408 [Coryphaenoides rupestris]